MLIDDQYREVVCFLCVDKKKGRARGKKVEAATGFFVSVPLNARQDAQAAYLVTARHVLDESRQDGILYAKMNLRNGGVEYIPVPQDSWRCHLSTDIAVIESPLTNKHRSMAIPHSFFVDDSYASTDGIDVGDELFALGLFTEYAGDHQAEPIARFGHVSLGLKTHYLKLNSGTAETKIDAYLGEIASWGGQSGSPVFHCKWPVSNRQKVPIGDPRGPHLLGLLHGHYKIWQTSESKDKFSLNSGIGIIIPAKQITEVLMSPECVSERDEMRKQMDAERSYPVPDISS